MSSEVGLAIQCVGVMLITLLSFFITRSIRDRSLNYWTIAWACLSASLFSLLVAFEALSLAAPFYSLYFFGEYAFGFMFIQGCRSYAAAARVTRRQLYPLIPGMVLALALPHFTGDFNDLFIVQASIMAVLFTLAFVVIRPARRRNPSSLGLKVMSFALLLLAADFLHYVPVFGVRFGLWGLALVPQGYLQFTSIVDLILETLLGFGTVMVMMERVSSEVEEANRELVQARDRLEIIARMDPMTEALNRHAFHSLLSKAAEPSGGVASSGCVAVIDIDNLKPINDSLGHATGDQAIRAVARAVRSVVRADDMLFRWGGDEFLVLMFGIPEAEARRRLADLNEILLRTEHLRSPIRLSVSHGLGSFEAMTQLEQAIERADEDMYRQKQERKMEERNLSADAALLKRKQLDT
jgi:diguanylate cyclase (GGDEF)-like protein